MNKRTIRFKKPEWREWVYEKVDESEVDRRVIALEAMGYTVEK